MKINVDKINTPIKNGVQVTWLGHASVLFQMEDLCILADPVFNQRASPVQWSGPTRYRPVPVATDSVPANVTEAVRCLHLKTLDAVIISHNHYDHLDEAAVRALAMQYPDVRWFVPKGVDEWLHQTIDKSFTRGKSNIKGKHRRT